MDLIQPMLPKMSDLMWSQQSAEADNCRWNGMQLVESWKSVWWLHTWTWRVVGATCAPSESIINLNDEIGRLMILLQLKILMSLMSLVWPKIMKSLMSLMWPKALMSSMILLNLTTNRKPPSKLPYGALVKHRCLHATICKALQLKDWIVMENATINWNERVDWSTKLSKNMVLLFNTLFESILHDELFARWAASKRWLISLSVTTPIFVFMRVWVQMWWHWWHVAIKMKA